MLNIETVRSLRFGRPGSDAADRLVCGDNLRLLAGLPDGGVDLVYVDPPFGTGAIRRGQRDARYRDDLADPERLVVWLEPRLVHIRRALALHGSLFCHLDYRAVHYVKVALDRLFGRQLFINEIVWCYSVGGKSRRSFGRKHDVILWYARAPDYAFFPDAVRIPRKPASHMRVCRGPSGEIYQEKTDRRTGKVYRYPISDGKLPEDWWIDIETLNRGDRERTGYPTQKPERLIERIVRATSQPGALVADFFCGSGTTPVVAQRLDRRFVAVDSSEAAVRTTAQRLDRQGRKLAATGALPRDVRILWQPIRAHSGTSDPDSSRPESLPASIAAGTSSSSSPSLK